MWLIAQQYARQRDRRRNGRAGAHALVMESLSRQVEVEILTAAGTVSGTVAVPKDENPTDWFGRVLSDPHRMVVAVDPPGPYKGAEDNPVAADEKLAAPMWPGGAAVA